MRLWCWSRPRRSIIYNLITKLFSDFEPGRWTASICMGAGTIGQKQAVGYLESILQAHGTAKYKEQGIRSSSELCISSELQSGDYPSQEQPAHDTPHVNSGELHTFKSLEQAAEDASCSRNRLSSVRRRLPRPSGGADDAPQAIEKCLSLEMAAKLCSGGRRSSSVTPAGPGIPVDVTHTGPYTCPEAASLFDEVLDDNKLERRCSCPLLFKGGPPAGNCPHMPIACCSLDPDDPSLTPQPVTEQITFPYTPVGRWRNAFTRVRGDAADSAGDVGPARRTPRGRDSPACHVTCAEGTPADASRLTRQCSADSGHSSHAPLTGEAARAAVAAAVKRACDRGRVSTSSSIETAAVRPIADCSHAEARPCTACPQWTSLLQESIAPYRRQMSDLG